MPSVNLFAGLDDLKDRENYVRAPFAYHGGKSKSLGKILPHLPVRGIYVESFGGSGAILLARAKSKLEVFNDRYAGVVAFYRCIRDKQKMNRMMDQLSMYLHSREEFMWCRDTWDTCQDDVERASRWYYMMRMSFGSQGRAFGRCVQPPNVMAAKLRRSLPEFPAVHDRIKDVQIENIDAIQCMYDYDSEDCVHYVDPPYLGAYQSAYKVDVDEVYHRRLLQCIFSLKGYVALSGYANPLYDNHPWDERHEWEQNLLSKASIPHSDRETDKVPQRQKATEVLWIKY